MSARPGVSERRREAFEAGVHFLGPVTAHELEQRAVEFLLTENALPRSDRFRTVRARIFRALVETGLHRVDKVKHLRRTP